MVTWSDQTPTMFLPDTYFSQPELLKILIKEHPTRYNQYSSSPYTRLKAGHRIHDQNKARYCSEQGPAVV